jgi:hypothetical protein
LLLALVSAVILGSESRGTRDNILLSQIRDLTFRCLLPLTGSQWRYSTPPPHGNRIISYLNGRLYSVSLSYNIFVDYSYPWTRLLIPQQRAGFQQSISFMFVSQETCLPTRSLAMDRHVTISSHFSVVELHKQLDAHRNTAH